MQRLRLLLPLCLTLCVAPLAPADEEALPAGHSAHGAAFNEGPRGKATLMGGTGDVDFPVTTRDARTQAFMNQGIGQLHGFWYFEAERSFRQAAAFDPGCAMAYWGMALARRNNETRAKAFIAKAVERRTGTTAREQAYIDALSAYFTAGPARDRPRRQAWIEALAAIVEKHPDDLEARALLGLEHWSSARYLGLKDRGPVDALLRSVLEKKPLHPVHHFRIHLWDGRKTAATALDSAARCGQSAPSVAHMWHMPGHIYTALNRFADAAWQQEASARTDHAYLVRDRVLPDQIFNYAHNNEWLIRNLMIVGRVHDAIALAQNMIELPRHPRYNHFRLPSSSSGYGRRRLFEVLEYYEMWPTILEMTDGTYLEPTDNPGEQVRRLRARALANVMQRKWSAGKREMRELVRRRPELIRELEQTATEARAKATTEGLAGEALEKAIAEARKPGERLIQMVDSVMIEMECYLLLAGGQAARAVKKLDQAKTMPQERRARFYLAAGDLKRAEALIRQVVKRQPGRVQPLANLVDILWRCRKYEDAKQAFGQLRAISGHIDRLDTPAFARISPLGRKLGWGSDWRIEPTVPDDVGERPDLDSLGPFRWTSYEAPKWKLPDETGKMVSLDGFRGRKPTVVIFYLGWSCVHCVEQLNAFKPMTEAFRKAGIRLIAISTDSVPGLAKSLGKGGYPFPLVSNASLDVFKAYRCHDDFENQPLHGTFLLDRNGVVRWQDISYEPFLGAAFLLKEARRLLGQRFRR